MVDPKTNDAKQTGKQRELISDFSFLCYYFAGFAEIWIGGLQVRL